MLTASGKKTGVEQMAAAEAGAREGLRERTEAGHRKAGRVPPSQVERSRQAGAVKIVDERPIDQSIRDYIPPLITEDEKLLRASGAKILGVVLNRQRNAKPVSGSP